MASVRKREWTHKGQRKQAWVVDYTDQSGTRRMKTFGSKKEADKGRLQIETEIEKGDHVAASQSATVREVCEGFIDQIEQRLKDSTLGRYTRNQYERTTRLHIVPALGNKLMSTLTVQDLDYWYAGLMKAGKARKSRSHYLMIFGMVEEFARRRGYTKRQPVADFKSENRKGGARHAIKTFTVEDVGRIFQALQSKLPGSTERQYRMMKCAVYLSAICGLRKGEIFGLTHDHLDLDAGVIRIRHSLTVFNELKGPKTQSGIRDVDMPAIVVDALRDWTSRYCIPNDRNLVFTSRSGKPVEMTSSHHKSWRILLAAAGIQERSSKGYHFHALRHFAASWGLDMGMAPQDVAKMLGHRSFDVTLQIYAHSVRGDDYRKMILERNTAALVDATRARHETTTI